MFTLKQTIEANSMWCVRKCENEQTKRKYSTKKKMKRKIKREKEKMKLNEQANK